MITVVHFVLEKREGKGRAEGGLPTRDQDHMTTDREGFASAEQNGD
jgi:hypothetical protein